MANGYHIFGTKVFGRDSFYKFTDDEQELLAFVKENHDHETVSGLRVVYGEILEFEPATVIETFRIKR